MKQLAVQVQYLALAAAEKEDVVWKSSMYNLKKGTLKFSSNRPIRSSSRNVCLSVCLYDVPFHVIYFEAYFSPTSQSRMSKIFRDSESFGKSSGNKWSQN